MFSRIPDCLFPFGFVRRFLLRRTIERGLSDSNLERATGSNGNDGCECSPIQDSYCLQLLEKRNSLGIGSLDSDEFERYRDMFLRISKRNVESGRMVVPTVEYVKSAYDRFNSLYFGSSLPDMSRDDIMIVDGLCGASAGVVYGTPRIKVGRNRMDEYLFFDLILHEMVHILVRGSGFRGAPHGIPFLREIRRLNSLGWHVEDGISRVPFVDLDSIKVHYGESELSEYRLLSFEYENGCATNRLVSTNRLNSEFYIGDIESVKVIDGISRWLDKNHGDCGRVVKVTTFGFVDSVSLYCLKGYGALYFMFDIRQRKRIANNLKLEEISSIVRDNCV